MQAIAYRQLSELVMSFSRRRKPSPDLWVRKFFEVLDWGKRAAFRFEKATEEGYQLVVDNAPVITVIPSSPNDVDAVYGALSYSYNKDIPWVVASDFKSLGIFGSYWPSFNFDVSSALAFEITHSQYLADSYQLELLTPKSVASSEINQLYSNFTGRKRRLPIDQHLVQRMEGWRKLILYSLDENLPDRDQLTHRLINTLFLTRYLEDTKKIGPVTLRELLQMPDDIEFQFALGNLFDDIHYRTRYNVPSKAGLADVPASAIRQLSDQLYGYPTLGIEYDFAAMNVDVLGRFYEEYLRQDLVVKSEPDAERSLFEPEAYELQDTRRQKGIYYTPPYIVDFILNSVIERFSKHSKALPIVADIAVGSGTFLTAAVDHLLKHYPKTKDNVAQLSQSLVGFDADERAIEAARLNLTAKFIAEGSAEPFPEFLLETAEIISEGVEQDSIKAILPEGADIVVGNPPYISYTRLTDTYDLDAVSQLYENAVGRTDAYIIFVEAALRLVKPGGYVGLVLPSSILRTKVAGRLRDWIADSSDLLEVVDFVEQTVFTGVGAYVCLLIIRKRSPNTVSPDLTVARIYLLSDTPATQLAGVSASEIQQEGSEVFMTSQPSGRSTWNFRNRVETALLEKLRAASDSFFEDVVSIRQGIKSGADDVFIVESTSFDDKYIASTSPNRSVSLERSLLIPALRNRDLRRWGSRASAFLIYPYHSTENRILSWEEIEGDFPGVAEYLQSNHSRLAKRKSLRGKEWYSLIEPRLATVFGTGKELVTAEIGLRPKISVAMPDDSAVVGNAWLTLSDEEYDRELLMAYLNSSVSEWYLRQIAPLLQGGYLLIRQTNFSKLPIPRFLKESDQFAALEIKQMSRELAVRMMESKQQSSPSLVQELAAKEEKIDSLLMEALGFNFSEAEQLRKTNGLARRAASNVP